MVAREEWPSFILQQLEKLTGIANDYIARIESSRCNVALGTIAILDTEVNFDSQSKLTANKIVIRSGASVMM